MLGQGGTNRLMIQVFVAVLLIYFGGGAYYVYSQSSQPLGGRLSLTPTAETVALRPAALTQVVMPTSEIVVTAEPTPVPTFFPGMMPTAADSPTSTVTNTPAATPTAPPSPQPTAPEGTVEYTVQTGDNVDSIARSFGIGLDDLLSANPDLRDRPDSLAVGQVLRVPVGPGGAEATPTPQPWVTYVVQDGDTLGGIADRFGVTSESIVQANGLGDPDAIKPGDELRIPTQ